MSTVPCAVSNAGQALTGRLPSTISTPVTRSEMFTRPEPLQSPTQALALRVAVGDGLGVRVAVDVSVGVGRTVRVSVAVGVIVGGRAVVSVAVAVAVSDGAALAVLVGGAIAGSVRV